MTNWSSKSSISIDDVPASGKVFNLSCKGDDSRARDNGMKKNENVMDFKPERKVDCWNCDGN